ncbi:ankyrin repeat [Fusarium pseudocircinatum]|uniref:Ankyrin repeat n=1 Tax=Fusarium pseudocircinatum TaxID=56676 RepID=A0A8H5L4J1_9HYPO|nr:ankyrin repeat [Fusarium pseudocircinatum]
MSLEYDKQQLGKKLFILESWHKDPRICEKGKTALKSKAWKFNMSTSDKIAAGSLGVAIFGGIMMAVNQFRKKPEPVQVAANDQKPDSKDGQDGNINVESQNDIALYAVSLSSNQDMAAILLDWKANTEIADECDWTPLYVSSLYVTNAIVDLPLERKENPNLSPYFSGLWMKRSPLHEASMQRPFLPPLSLLLDLRAYPKLADEKGYIALHSAVQAGHDLALAFTPLLQRGADSNIAAADGWTPLLWAVNQMTELGNSSEAVLKTLLDASLTDVNRVLTISSDITIPVERDGQHITPILQAAACHSPEEVKILRHLFTDASSKKKMACDISLAYIAALHGHSDSPRLVLECGADANAADVEGRTPLHLTARHSHPECISLLLVHGADVNAKANDRGTALYEAVSIADEDCVRLLLDAGADMLAERDPRVGEVSLHRQEGWSIEALRQSCEPDEEERPRGPTVAELRERYQLKFSTEAGQH